MTDAEKLIVLKWLDNISPIDRELGIPSKLIRKMVDENDELSGNVKLWADQYHKAAGRCTELQTMTEQLTNAYDQGYGDATVKNTQMGVGGFVRLSKHEARAVREELYTNHTQPCYCHSCILWRIIDNRLQEVLK